MIAAVVAIGGVAGGLGIGYLVYSAMKDMFDDGFDISITEDDFKN